MHRKHAYQAISIFIIASFAVGLPVAAHVHGLSADPKTGGFLVASQDRTISTEEIDIILGMPSSFDVDEPIYATVSVVRNAKADYVKPLSIRFELYSEEFGDEFIIGSNYGEYKGDNWVTVNKAEVERLNNFVYYTSFDPFSFDASLIMRVTVEWFSPWQQVLTKTVEKPFGVGNWFNITNKLSVTRDDIQRSILDKVDLGIEFSAKLMENIASGLEEISLVVTQITELLSSAAIDPAGFNIYVIDLIGNSTNPGPLYNVVRHDLYSHLPSGSRDTAMDARHRYIINSVKDSLLPLKSKLGDDTDASDGEYAYTITFIRRMYEQYSPDAVYLNPSTTVDTFNSIVYSDEYGNVTGTDWDAAYGTGTQGKASLEFLLEPTTGAHPKFKSASGAKHNTRPVGKGIVLNTMGPYFPAMNSWYDYYELSPSDKPATVVKNGSDVPYIDMGSDDQRMLFDDSDPLKNIRRLALYYNVSDVNFIGSSIIPGDGNDIFDNFTNYQYPGYIQEFYKTSNVPMLRYGLYIYKLAAGMAGNYYNWVNLGGGKPFSRFTRDTYIANGVNLQVSDGSHDLIIELENETCNTRYWNGVSFDARLYGSPWGNYSSFHALDALIGLTNDHIYHTIDSRPIGSTNTEYYKTDVGRWIDAFFNGTDLSERDGKLKSANYITAAPDPTLNSSGDVFYSPKAKHYSFEYEDVYVFHRLGKLSDYAIPNEYTWAPFVGPNAQVPVGWMVSSNMWYSVVGTDDITMALEYLYGGIVMGYKETVLKYKSLALAPVYMGYQCGISEAKINYLVDQADTLDDAWANLDFREIDVIGTRILDALAPDRTNVDNDIMYKTTERLKNFTAIAYSFVAKDESDYSYIDTGLDTAGSDLEVGAVGDALNNLLAGSIPDALDYLQGTFNKTMNYLSKAKNRSFDSTISFANGLTDMVYGALNYSLRLTSDVANKTALGLETMGDRIVDVSLAMNETVANAINNISAWTTEQVNALAKATSTTVSEIWNFIDTNVLGSIENLSDFVYNATTSWVNVTEQIFVDIGDRIGDKVTSLSSILAGAGVFTLGAGAFTGNIPAGATGALLAALGLGGMAAGGFISNTVQGAAANVADVARNVLSKGNDSVYYIVNLTRTGGEAIFNLTNGTITLVRDYTKGTLDKVSDVATSVIGDLTGFSTTVGNTVGSIGKNIRDTSTYIQEVMESGLNRSYTWTMQRIDSVVEAMLENSRAIAYSIEANIKNVIQLVNLTNAILSEVEDKFVQLVDQVNLAFEDVNQLFATTTAFLIDLAGKAIDLTVDFSQDVATQLFDIEQQIASSTGFYQLMDPLLQSVQDSRVSASLIEYASQTIGVTKEILYKWKDVVQPIATAQGGDTGFRLFQMGTEFTDKLYFVTVYRGQLVDIDNITLRASRIPEEGEIIPGDLLEADIPLFTEKYENGSFIDGLYYASFSQDVEYDWYGDLPAPVKTESPIPASYLTRTDASYSTPAGSPHNGTILNATWMEETELFNATLTEDAFPIISILSDYPEPVTGGDTVPLIVSIQNTMYSKPVAEIEYSISTTTGFVIANRRIGNIVLPSSEEGEKAFDLEFTPLPSTPAGTYDLLVTVVEPNGDTTTVITGITIRGRTIFEEFTGFIIGIIGALLGLFGLGAFIGGKVKPGKKANAMSDAFGSIRFNAPTGCSMEGLSSGKCTIGGLSLDCDPDLHTCKFKT